MFMSQPHNSEEGLKRAAIGTPRKPCHTCVLIVEDYDAIRAYMARHFEREGFRVYSASNASNALALADTVLPQIVVVDYDLSHEDALTAVSQLRATLPGSIIMVYGGVESNEFHERVKACGADDVLTTGYDLESLDRLISQTRPADA